MPVASSPALSFALLFGAAAWAGVQNQVAGGGSFITLPALILTGMDARAANITSTVALFPGQLMGGWMGRRHAGGAGRLTLPMLIAISFVGGGIGAVLLLLTPSSFFDKLVPWLVLFATGAFAWGSFGRKPTGAGAHLHPLAAGAIQFVIAIYGGYFGGGIGFLMLAAFAVAGMAARIAGATKNILAGVMNCTAVLIFLFSGEVHWSAALIACAGALAGSYVGAHTLRRIDERLLRILVVLIGVTLTIFMFLRAAG